MFNERSQPRQQLIYHLRMFDDATKQVAGYVSNISPEGVRLMTEEPIPLNSRFHFRLELPHLIEGKRVLELVAINMWTHTSDRSHFYESGFRFESLSATERECIARLMFDYGLGTGLH